MNIHKQAVGCEYSILDNGIHQFVFTGKGNSGIDELFAYLSNLWAIHSADETLYYLVDTTHAGGDTSMVQLLDRFRQLERTTDERPAGRTAIIHEPDVLISLADSFIRTFAPRRDKTRFFRSGSEDSAIQWLLSVQ